MAALALPRTARWLRRAAFEGPLVLVRMLLMLLLMLARHAARMGAAADAAASALERARARPKRACAKRRRAERARKGVAVPVVTKRVAAEASALGAVLADRAAHARALGGGRLERPPPQAVSACDAPRGGGGGGGDRGSRG